MLTFSYTLQAVRSNVAKLNSLHRSNLRQNLAVILYVPPHCQTQGLIFLHRQVGVHGQHKVYDLVLASSFSHNSNMFQIHSRRQNLQERGQRANMLLGVEVRDSLDEHVDSDQLNSEYGSSSRLLCYPKDYLKRRQSLPASPRLYALVRPLLFPHLALRPPCCLVPPRLRMLSYTGYYVLFHYSLLAPLL